MSMLPLQAAVFGPRSLFGAVQFIALGVAFSASSFAAGGDIDVGSGNPKRLRVAVKEIPPFVYADQATPAGFSIDLWTSIAQLLGVQTDFVVFESVADVLDAVETGVADAGIAAITINAEREARVDFSHPFYHSGLRVGVPSRSGPTWASSFGRLLSYDLLAMLASLVGLTLIASHLLWFVERGVNPDCFPATYFRGVGESLWWSVATIITGGCENKAPVSLSGRLVAVAWMLGSIVLVASFTATLSSQMTAETVAGAITGPDDLPGRLVATVAKTSVVPVVRQRNARVLEQEDLAAAMKAVKEGRADVVVFDAPVLSHAINTDGNSGVRLVGPLFEQQDYGVIVQRGSSLRKAINQALLTLSEKGILMELSEKWFGQREP